jgi:BCD family chlorophyll transporter-like MFS transporter
MMGLAGAGGANQEGVRMGLWGAAQAQAFALGGIVGTAASDLARWLLASPGPAYALVFVANAALFLVAARLAARVDAPAPAPQPSHLGQLRRAP